MGMPGYGYRFEFAEPEQNRTRFHGCHGYVRVSACRNSGQVSDHLTLLITHNTSNCKLRGQSVTITTIAPRTTAVSSCSRGENGDRGQLVGNHNGHSTAQTTICICESSFGPIVSFILFHFSFL